MKAFIPDYLPFLAQNFVRGSHGKTDLDYKQNANQISLPFMSPIFFFQEGQRLEAMRTPVDHTLFDILVSARGLLQLGAG